MKTEHSVFGLLAIVLIIASIPLTTGSKPALADPGVLKWTRIDTPGGIIGRNDITSPSEVSRIAIGSDGKTFYAVDIANADTTTGSKALYKSTDKGISWSDAISRYLYQSMSPAEQNFFRVWDIAVAPDDVNFVAVVTNDSTTNLPWNVWVSTDGGVGWENTNCPAGGNISTIDISPNYGTRDIAIGTRTGTGGGTIWMVKTPGYNNWVAQGFTGDVMALKFSPSYRNDATIAIVYSDTTGTYLNAGIHDLNANTTDWTVIYVNPQPEITTGESGSSPKADQIISADLELPSDFSGQASSLRRFYISIDDAGTTNNGGIYRFDNTLGYRLMSATMTKRISSIAYYGTYASGKLLAGEVLGNPCSATVLTWFTDAPTTCPIPCWYPAMKPPTGAAGTDNCTGSGYGNAQIDWSPDGTTAYVGTASSKTLAPGVNWPNPYMTGEDLDESAFSLSRNNGEIWNQLAFIDTRISQLLDIAISPDCSTVYLASVNENLNCSGFDSVWRSQSSPIGSIWERVLCATTTEQACTTGQTDRAILSLAGDKADGQIICWAAVGTRKMMWSPDFGDYWASINPGLVIQDMATEDSKTLYVLNATGWVQKFTFSGTGWVSHAAVPTELDTGYSIATAYTGLTPDNDKGHIIVGSTGTGIYDVAYSTDGGATFTPIVIQLPTRGNTLVVASSGYKSDGNILAINSGGMYCWGIYSGKYEWEAWWGGPSRPSPVTSLAISRNYGFYFSTPASPYSPATPYIRWSAATAGLDPSISLGNANEPTGRLKICGGLETGEPVTAWVIDQRPYSSPQGGVWCYTDTLPWIGPTPISPVSETSVNYDPVTGRASEINLRWKPVSLSRGYQIQIAKDEDFALRVADIGSAWGGPFYTPYDLDTPALAIPPGGGTIIDSNGNTWTIPPLEAGHAYYWRIKVQDVAFGDAIKSPWSWREIFTVKTGLRIATPYYGPQLLLPDNGCLGCPVKSASFAWSPFMDTVSYKLVLAKDSAMRDIIVEADVPTTAYTYEGTLDYNSNYFWQVMAIEPFPSDWSATFCFQTEAAPIPPQPPQAAQVIPLWIWVIIAIGVVLDISLFVLILRRRLT
ncbi:MAG: hypothetical protein FJ005_05410 [Chloroflexi bacterium]|nr:hypothetical protein [Chloroflexota bacterium]